MLEDIRAELDRIGATDISVALDDDFEPDVGTMVRVQHDEAYWHLLPERFLELLKDIRDGAGAAEVHDTIEREGVGVWRGPSPKDSRDASS